MLNAIMTGRLGRDAEVKQSNNGEYVMFPIAVEEGYGKDAVTHWVTCTYWRTKLAPYLVKGTQVTVVGSLSAKVWTPNNGEPKVDMLVRVSEIALGARPEGQGGSQGSGQNRAQAPAPAAEEDHDDDLPPF